MVVISVREKNGEVSRFDFSSLPIRIGRVKGCDIVLPKGNVSNEHALIHAESSTVFVTDLHSTNGVYVNGRRIPAANPTPVESTDKIYIGDFILQLDEPGGTTAPTPQNMGAHVNEPLRESASNSLEKGSRESLPTVVAESRPSAVTVYARGAEVTRRLEIDEVPATAFELRVTDVTQSADPSSFRFDLGGLERELVSLRTELHYPSEIGEFGKTVEELEEVRREINRLAARFAVLEERKSGLAGLEFANGRRDDEYDASERAQRGREIAESVDERIANYDAQLVELSDEIFELERREQRLRLADEQASDVDRVGATRPRRVLVARFAAGESTDFSNIELTYVVNAARWWPVYRIDLEDQGRRARVDIEVLVAQNSGENWENVSMAFATSDLNVDARLPKLKSLRLGRAQPETPSGFRPPPKNTDALFASFDQAFGAGSAPAHAPVARASAPPANAQAFIDEEVTGEYDQFGYDEAAAFAEIEEETAFDEPQMMSRSMAAPPPPAAPQAAMAPPKGSGFFGGGAPPAKAKRRSGARPSRPEPPAGSAEPESGWLDFENLRMEGPSSHRRGKLLPQDNPMGGHDSLTSANETARRHEAVDPIVSRGSFDYRYDTDGVADVPSDGMVHRITVTTADTESDLSWRVVPREDESVYRVAELDNPHASPLLTGPVEVYADGGLVTTTTLSHVASGGQMSVGLGVDERIRVARNARVDEESAGLLGGKREVDHEVEIELRSNLGFKARVIVLDRIPVTDDDDVKVELLKSKPQHEDYDQKDEGRPIRGGMKWQIELEAGGSRRVEFAYKIVLRAKDEIIGGNRRE